MVRIKKLDEMSNEELWMLFPIILKKHNEDYKDWYQEEKDSISSILEGKAFRISHIGSSSVKGLMSKPTIDILLEIDSERDSEIIVKKILSKGWIKMHEQKDPYWSVVFNKGYTIHGFEEKVYHLHMRLKGDWDEIYFRDYLLEHPEVAREYEILKKVLLKKYKYNRDKYTDGKTDFILKWTNIARKHYKK